MAACGEDPQSPSGPESTPALGSAAGALSFSQVSVGGIHTCGLATDGRTYCWGRGNLGQLGTGAFVTSRTRPTLVTGGLRFVQVSAGFNFTCGVTGDNRAYCWGANDIGQLGDGTNTNRSAPVPVAGGRRFRQIRAGFSHTCAVNTANVAFCWGGTGALGNGTSNPSNVPVRVLGGQQWRRVAAGGYHSCGITTSNRAFCWGANETSQLGDGTRTRRNRPVPVAGGMSFIQLIPGSSHTCGVTTDARAWCWGSNDNGETGTEASGFPFAPVAGNRRFTQVIAGFLHTCGVTQAKLAFCWGYNGYGQNGDGSTSLEVRKPTQVVGGLEFVGVSTGVQNPPPFASPQAVHSCGITANNRIYCWGGNGAGQLGDGTTTQRLTPTAVVGP
jgi:alpha-tubulin suppressor-like RCC1 family protein